MTPSVSWPSASSAKLTSTTSSPGSREKATTMPAPRSIAISLPSSLSAVATRIWSCSDISSAAATSRPSLRMAKTSWSSSTLTVVSREVFTARSVRRARSRRRGAYRRL
ncbi:hypothetical protein WBK31_14245 [Nonomuraea sp. N2-4H]|uniref:hypothetical protein n=1 Tax=Nonomuraea sp. N2-4H TaxID=3128898 RepID=UPI0032440170